MQRILIIGLLLALVLAFMVTYIVRFNETAVVVTLGKADESSVIRTSGLHGRLPYPFQKVIKYDTRFRLIQSDQETQQTADKSQVLVTSFVTWKVSDPLKFFKRFGGSGDGVSGSGSVDNPREHYREAERIIKAKLRSAAGEVARFRISDLLSINTTESKIADLEKAMLDRVNGDTAGETKLSEYGIETQTVGISGIGFPQETTKTVFERMKSGRLKIANELIAQGQSEAAAIRSAADNDAKKIKAFAEQLAASIRTQGDIEAATYYKQMTEDPQLAVFIQNMSFFKKSFGKSTTFVIPTSIPGFELLRPDAAKKFSSGRPPVPDMAGVDKLENTLAKPSNNGASNGGGK